MTFVYWRRPAGSLSHLHRVHPDTDRYTWCGAVCQEGRADVYQVTHLAAQPRGVELCEACEKMSKPMKFSVRDEVAA